MNRLFIKLNRHHSTALARQLCPGYILCTRRRAATMPTGGLDVWRQKGRFEADFSGSCIKNSISAAVQTQYNCKVFNCVADLLPTHLSASMSACLARLHREGLRQLRQIAQRPGCIRLEAHEPSLGRVRDASRCLAPSPRTGSD